MAYYVDGFVLPILKEDVELYRSIAQEAGKVWREHGALEYRECVAEDTDAKEMVSFPQPAEKRRPDSALKFVVGMKRDDFPSKLSTQICG